MNFSIEFWNIGYATEFSPTNLLNIYSSPFLYYISSPYCTFIGIAIGASKDALQAFPDDQEDHHRQQRHPHQ